MDYLLNAKEEDSIISRLKRRINIDRLQDMYENANQERFARNMLVPFFETEIEKRDLIAIPSYVQIVDTLRKMLAEMSDNSGSK